MLSPSLPKVVKKNPNAKLKLKAAKVFTKFYGNYLNKKMNQRNAEDLGACQFCQISNMILPEVIF